MMLGRIWAMVVWCMLGAVDSSVLNTHRCSHITHALERHPVMFMFGLGALMISDVNKSFGCGVVLCLNILHECSCDFLFTVRCLSYAVSVFF
jgi:hypothetical protein